MFKYVPQKSVLLCLLSLTLALLSVGWISSSVLSASQSTNGVPANSQPATDSVRIIALTTNDIVFNTSDEKIYASVPSSAGNTGNSITTVNPRTGVIGSPVFVGSEPSKLVFTANSQKLYVHLAGAYSIAKFDIATQLVESRFSLGQEPFFGLYTAKDFVVAPDDPDLIAVARYYLGTSPPQGGVAAFKNGVRLPQTGPGHSAGSHYLSFGASGSTLYGSNDYGIKTMTVNSNGITLPANNSTTTIGGYSSFKIENGMIFTSVGQVINAVSGLLMGTFPNAATQSYQHTFVPNAASGRAYYLVRDSSAQNTWVLRAYDINTFTQAGSLVIPNIMGEAGSLVRWGTNGLAFRTSGNQLFLVQTSLIPTDNPLPEPPPVPVVSPTPTPAALPTFIRKIDSPANDVVYNSQTNSVLISVPGTAGVGLGNTISHINPETGVIGASVFIGSEPNKLAASDDGQTLYATLDGANAIRRYNIATKTSGLQFATTSGFWQPDDIAVMPNYPGTIAVAGGNDGVAIVDDGVQRPGTSNGGAYAINSIAFSSISNIFYGYDSYSSGFELIRFTANGPGVTGTNVGNNLLSGYSNKIKFANGLIYSNSGRVIDPAAPRVAGTYQASGSAMAVDPVLRRVFFVSDSVLSAFDMDTFIKIGSVMLPSGIGTPTTLVRWGGNGLALRTGASYSGSPGSVYILQSALVSPSAAVPTGVQLGTGPYFGYEGSSTITVTVTRTGDLSGISTVNYATVDGTAMAGLDYTLQNGTITFNPGESGKNISIPITNDAVYEANESFSVSLTAASSGVLITSPSAANITVVSDDSRPRISNINRTVAEPRVGNTLTANVQVQLSNPSVESVSVNYSTSNGSALAGSDYAASSGTLTFGPLETVKTIPVMILADTGNEATENFLVNLTGAVNSSIQVSQAVVTIQNTITKSPVFDFDGDGRSDLSVFRPADRTWYILRGLAGYTAMEFGLATDMIVPADYDNDGKTDIAIFRPSEGNWYIFNSASQTFQITGWGEIGDIPVPTDHDGDFKADLVVFRPSNGTWYRKLSADNSWSTTTFGTAGDRPIAGDFDGDGKADIAVFRPSDNNWYVLKTGVGYFIQNWGESGDVPVPADYDGDGKTDFAVFRPSSGQWFRVNSSNNSIDVISWGVNGDKPGAADYDGDGKSDVAVFRPSSGTWYIVGSTAGQIINSFGQNGDLPTQGAFIY